jgi:hypothetical protein
VARSFRAANFAEILGYNARRVMYFPAGIPFVALLALIAWNTWQEAERSRKSSEPRAKSRG